MKRIYLAFFASLALLSPLQGAHLLDVGDEKEGYQTPYAHLQNPKPQAEKEVFYFEAKHLITDLEEPQEDLGDDVDSVVKKLEDKNSFFFLGAILKRTQSNAHYRCLIVSPALKKEQKAIKRAKQKNFYLIESESEHFLLQLIGLLHVAKKYTIEALYSNPYLCRNCHLLALHLFEIRLPLNEKGCLGVLFPSSEKMPTSALAYINNHLTLPLVKQLVVPMMGYVKGDEVQVKDQEIVNLRRQLEQKNASIQQKEDQLQDKQNKLNEYQTRNNALQNSVLTKDTQINTLQNKLNSLGSQIDTLKQNSDNDKDKIKSLNIQIQRLKAEVNNKNNQLQSKDVQLQRKDEQLDEQKEEIEVNLAEIDKNEIQIKKEKYRNPLDEKTQAKWWKALKIGDENVAKDILAHYVVDVNAKNEYGDTPLHAAALYNRKEVAELLIAAGANKNIKNNKNQTPLDWAKKHGHKEMIDLLT